MPPSPLLSARSATHTYLMVGLKGECPDDAGQCAQDSALVDGFACMEDGLHHIEG